MWGGGRIGVRFSDGNDGVGGHIGFSWEALGTSSVSNIDPRWSPAYHVREQQKGGRPYVPKKPTFRGDARKAG